MYAQKQENNWRELAGNYLFASNVYQTAESLSDEQREEFKVYFIEDVARPNLSKTQKFGNPIFTIKGNVVERSYPVVDKTPEEITQDTTNKSTEVREQRNELLSQSDWTQLADSVVDKTTWAAYRQALRDLTKQSGFPWEVTWPDAP